MNRQKNLWTFFKKNSVENIKGYSLMELIAVIVVIAILAAVLIPGYLHFIVEAKKDAVISDARAVYLAAQMRATESKALESQKKPYSIPGANDVRDLLMPDGIFEGVTYLTVIDDNRDGTIDKVELIKNNIDVVIEPGNKVTVDGKERTQYDGEVHREKIEN